MSSDDKRPDPRSVRTTERAVALTVARGCVEWNECWHECVEASRDAIVEGWLDSWDKAHASTSAYWRLTHGPPAAVVGHAPVVPELAPQKDRKPE